MPTTNLLDKIKSFFTSLFNLISGTPATTDMASSDVKYYSLIIGLGFGAFIIYLIILNLI